MRILLDQCVPRKFLRIIHQWGHEVILLQEHIDPDSSDKEVVELARELDAVMLTVDMDFANILDYPPQDYEGLIVMRYKVNDEEAATKTLHQLLNDLDREELRGILVVITADRYRIRRN